MKSIIFSVIAAVFVCFNVFAPLVETKKDYTNAQELMDDFLEYDRAGDEAERKKRLAYLQALIQWNLHAQYLNQQLQDPAKKNPKG